MKRYVFKKIQLSHRILKANYKYQYFKAYLSTNIFQMSKPFTKENDQLINIEIATNKHKLDEIINSYSFYFISEEFHLISNYNIIHNLKQSEVLIIDQYPRFPKNCDFFIIGFNGTIMIIKESIMLSLANFFSENIKIPIYFISTIKNVFNQKIKLQNNNQIESDDIFISEIMFFNQYFIKFKKNPIFPMNKMFHAIISCISGYLIRKSYIKLHKSQTDTFSLFQKVQKPKFRIFDENNIILLRTIGSGSAFNFNLIFEIDRCELFGFKTPNSCDNELEKLIKREYNNYQHINYPFTPKLYGKIKNKIGFVIQFIEGQTLTYIEKMNFNFEDKITVIFQMLLIFDYFHENGFVYRDLKPNNLIFDLNNKTLFVIDFDRMIKMTDAVDNIKFTCDFSSSFVAPEVNYGIIDYKNDIYSIGQMIYYIMNRKIENSTLQNIYKKCINKEINQRPSIFELICEIYVFFYEKINKSLIPNFNKDKYLNKIVEYAEEYITKDVNKSIHYYLFAANQNNPIAQFKLGQIYEEGEYLEKNINKAIHYYSLAADQNHLNAQINLGYIYEEGEYLKPDINKSIHYFTLAAKQNDPEAQFNLGFIYSEGKYIKIDINKAIHYYTLAANQGHVSAQFNLGLFYSNGKYIKRDINKAIHYLSLASDQNHKNSQYKLGIIYYEGKYINVDIDKAIKYFTLAANQNEPKSQFNLGGIYYGGEYVKRDINKAIYYFKLAAENNHLIAQLNLGLIYSEGKYVTLDINNAIYYYTLAANQNHAISQFKLGLIYYEGKYITKNINKAIKYFKLAADNNHPISQFILGLIYSEGKYVTLDINKAIYYYTLAANQNHLNSQFNLGLIYYEGNYIKQDINKAIYYFSLTADKYDADSLYILGLIYYEGKYIKQDINKAIYYFSLAADRNHLEAQFGLGFIYFEGKLIKKDINKAFHYYSLASKQNHQKAQFHLGILYLFYMKQINKGINLIIQSSSNGNIQACFCTAFLYHEGKYIERDIDKSIKLYKNASSFNDQYAKNNLGIIYKNGIEKISKNIGLAIEYFDEAIKRFNDKLSMYNLAHIYIYEDINNERIDKSIQLLIKSYKQSFYQAADLLCIALIKKNGFDVNIIEKDLLSKIEKSSDLPSIICSIIKDKQLNYKEVFDKFFIYYKSIDFLYDFIQYPVKSNDLYCVKKHSSIKTCKNLTNDFYQGFDI